MKYFVETVDLGLYFAKIKVILYIRVVKGWIRIRRKKYRIREAKHLRVRIRKAKNLRDPDPGGQTISGSGSKFCFSGFIKHTVCIVHV